MKSLMIAVSAVLIPLAAAQPRIFGVANRFSFVPAGLPNHGIAPGSIFTIFGNELAESSTEAQALPLGTSLADVNVNITVRGVTTQALLYSVTSTQIAAVLPSSIPVGLGKVTVVSGGRPSTPAAIEVAASAFGILTLNQAGTGPAAAFDGAGQLLGFNHAVGPGDTITLWGSGLGAADGDASNPVDVEIGGTPATVSYRGRSALAGLEQINVIVPAGVSGCHVSAVVRTGNVVSNFVTIPVGSQSCLDTHTRFNATQIAGKDTITAAEIRFGNESIGPDNMSALNAAFSRYTGAQFAASGPGEAPSPGSCVVYTFRGTDTGLTNPLHPQTLHAGSVLDINHFSGAFLGPSAVFQDGRYSWSSTDTFFQRGTLYSFSNGYGGADIGAFAVGAAIAGSGGNGDRFAGGAGIASWTNADLTSIDRSQGLTITWEKSQDLSNYIQVSGSSASGEGDGTVGAVFYCTARTSLQRFTVPASVLMALPAGTSGKLSVATYGDGNSPPLRVSGVDVGYITGYSKKTLVVTYQ